MQQGKFTTIIVLSVFLLIFSFTVPMFDVWQGIMPSDNAWTTQDTLEALEDLDRGIAYIPELLHLATWIPAVLLLITSLANQKWGIIITSALGIILPAKVLFDKIVELFGSDNFFDGVAAYMNFEYGNICIGYYFSLAFFTLCLITACTIKKDALLEENPIPEQSAEKINVKYFCRQCGNELTANDELCPKCLCCFKIHVP